MEKCEKLNLVYESWWVCESFGEGFRVDLCWW